MEKGIPPDIRHKRKKRRRGDLYGYYWKAAVIDMVRNYDKLDDPTYDLSAINSAYKMAIDEALQNLDHVLNGKWKRKAIELRYFTRNPEKVDIVAMKVYASPSTVKNWCSEFIYEVGVRADRHLRLSLND